MKHLISKFIKDESGATAIEYGLIAALVAIVAIASMRTVGSQIKLSFEKVGTALTKANNVPS